MQESLGSIKMSKINSLYDKLTAAGINKFAAVLYVASLARKLSKTVDYLVTDSQAISWALSGVKPERPKVTFHNCVKMCLPVIDILALVDDEQVKNDVMLSLRASVYCKTKRITLYNIERVPEYSEYFLSRFIINNELDINDMMFEYKYSTSDSQKARVRILSRIIWDKYEY